MRGLAVYNEHRPTGVVGRVISIGTAHNASNGSVDTPYGAIGDSFVKVGQDVMPHENLFR
jgi:hypothetical protein